MRNCLIKAVPTLAFLTLALAAPAHAEDEKPKCEIAEVNPVTGHVFCIKPIGAPVEPPPPDVATRPCDANAHTEGDWTFGPKCNEQPAPAGE
ncbi:hypothetical protein V6C03_07020 [Methyloligella sp. 2.7D]|uniref:hypothetical protein n=1 Tax=unclassified Methyloligella TaxID=2625955 RepID=UPI00157D9130|nr:hypothetical protein [Methyloligella sp. GL2]QKP78354.1 hypothetical protein HT051_13425 [Methyloligella sp. GL2]